MKQTIIDEIMDLLGAISNKIGEESQDDVTILMLACLAEHDKSDRKFITSIVGTNQTIGALILTKMLRDPAFADLIMAATATFIKMKTDNFFNSDTEIN